MNTNTKTVVETYLNAVSNKDDWQSLLDENASFVSYGTPSRNVTGRSAFVDSTARFYAMVTKVDVLDLDIADDSAFAFVKYTLQPPAGEAFTSVVAEKFSVSGGAISSLTIAFDSAPYPGAPQQPPAD